MNIKHRSSVQEERHALFVDSVSVTGMKPSVVAYRLREIITVETTRSGKVIHREERSKVQEGFALAAHIPAFLAGTRASLPGVERKRETTSRSHLIMATPALLEHLRTKGLTTRVDGPEDMPRASETPFTDLTSGAPEDLVVFVDWGNFELLTRDGLPLPWVRHFDYIDARMYNGVYNLETAVAILSQRGDIILARDRYSKGFIHPIPGYNATSTQTHSLSFTWAPNVEDYRALVTRCHEIGGPYPSTNWRRAVFDLDLLGLRAGGAAKYDEFYASDPEPITYEEEF